MEFLHPEFLYYMLAPLFILFTLLLTQKESEATFFSEEVMSKLRVSSNTLTMKARNVLFMFIGILIVFALAEPVIPEGKVEVKAKSADIMIALDISDSMLAEDVYPNRLKLAKQKALELLKLAPSERIGVIGFAKNSYLVSPLSFDHEAVGFLLRQLNTDSITEKGTNFLSMLEVVDKSIKKESKKYLLIVSDGGDKRDFSQEIEYANEKGIAIFVLGVGSEKGAPIKLANGEFIKQNGDIIISKLNSEIATLATKTGGVFIQSVNSRDDMKAMLREIESHSEKKELKSQEIARFIPLFYFPLGLALFLLLITTSSMSKREQVNLPSAFIIAAFLSVSTDAKAGLLDFVELNKAKEAYEKGEYEKSSQIYEEYAQSSKKSESHYNAGNALYKQGKYKEAIASYQKATFEDEKKRANNFTNLGNSYVRQPSEENLKRAIKAYESSLKIREDKDTRENLEAVKKALEKKKEKQDKNKDNKEQNNEQKEDKKSQDNQNKEKDSQENEQKSDDKKEGDSQEEKNKQNEPKKKEDMKSKEKTKEDQEKQEKKDTREEEKEKKEQKNQEKTEELRDDKDKVQNTNSSSEAQKPNEMSDKEEQKWLQKLSQKSNSYLYKLNENNFKEEKSNEKPW